MHSIFYPEFLDDDLQRIVTVAIHFNGVDFADAVVDRQNAVEPDPRADIGHNAVRRSQQTDHPAGTNDARLQGTRKISDTPRKIDFGGMRRWILIVRKKNRLF